METKKQLETALHDAMRSNNELRKRTLRMALAAIKNAEIDSGSPLEEESILGILHKEVKSRKESIVDAQKANRPDLITTAESEIKIIEEFLPQSMDDNFLKDLVQSVIVEISASGIKDMGKVMKLALSKVQGRASGDQVSRVVRELLQN